MLNNRMGKILKIGFLLLIIIACSFIYFITHNTKQQTLNTRASASTEERALVGVRHFPSFISNNHQVRNAQEQLLASGNLLDPPQSWRDRWPYFTVIRAEDTIDIHEDDQRIIDQEIQLISKAGIDYWALEVDWIESNSNYNYTLDLYKTSQYKNLLKFALIITSETLKNPEWNGAYLTNIVEALKDEQYVKTSTGKPILYMWRFDTLVSEMGENAAKQRMRQFVTAVSTKSNKTPYIVMMDLGSRNNYGIANEFSAQARSSYLGDTSSCGEGGAYSNVLSDNLNQWNEEGVTSNPNGIDYIPLVTVGMDPRPKRFDKELFSYGNNPKWCEKGTPQQIAHNVRQALTWVKSHRNVTSEANTVLIASWMDITESGWLVPTLDEGNARLNALSTVLNGLPYQTPESPYTQNDPPQHRKGEILKLKPLSNSSLNANSPLIVSGVAPMSARLKAVLQGPNYMKTVYFINGKGIAATRPFTLEFGTVPPGGPYTITLMGVADDQKNNDVVFEKITKMNFLSL